MRAVGVFAAVLFIITSLRIFWGEPLLPTTSPLPFFAYPFLVLTSLGWIWSLLRERPILAGVIISRPQARWNGSLAADLSRPTSARWR